MVSMRRSGAASGSVLLGMVQFTRVAVSLIRWKLGESGIVGGTAREQ